jgi:hypothetical protein
VGQRVQPRQRLHQICRGLQPGWQVAANTVALIDTGGDPGHAPARRLYIAEGDLVVQHFHAYGRRTGELHGAHADGRTLTVGRVLERRS